jgi:hypothetical protein
MVIPLPVAPVEKKKESLSLFIWSAEDQGQKVKSMIRGRGAKLG